MSAEISSALLKTIPFLIAIVAIRFAITRSKFSKSDLYLSAPKSIQHFLIWWALFFLFILTTEFILFRIGLLEVSPWNHNLPSSIIRILGIVVLAPIAEELLFRGILLFKLEQWKIKRFTSILIQAGAFVGLHSFSYENTLSSNIGIAQTFADAIIYALAKYNSKSIYTPIAMHATGNLIAILERFIM